MTPCAAQFSASPRLPCSSGSTAVEPAPQAAVYRIDIVTGDVRGAGTHVSCCWRHACMLRNILEHHAEEFVSWFSCMPMQAPAMVQLVGSSQRSSEYVLGAHSFHCTCAALRHVQLLISRRLWWPHGVHGPMFHAESCCMHAVSSPHTSLCTPEQATTRTSTASSAAAAGATSWTLGGSWACCARSLCSRCARLLGLRFAAHQMSIQLPGLLLYRHCLHGEQMHHVPLCGAVVVPCVLPRLITLATTWQHHRTRLMSRS